MGVLPNAYLMYPVRLGFKGLEMALYWGLVASNRYRIFRDTCKVQVRSLGIFEQTGHSEAQGRQAW